MSGNAGTDPTTDFLGTTDEVELRFKVNNLVAMRYQPNASVPNILGGYFGNRTIAGGWANAIQNDQATIAGGEMNTISAGFGALGGGRENSIQLGADYGSIPGGFGNTVAGGYSFAAGHRAQANHQGAFVWSDRQDYPFTSTANNEFSVRATGGARFVSAIGTEGTPTSGVRLEPGGGSWASLSDRGAKTNVQAVDARVLLERLARLPISTWNYRSQDASVRHIGPMAQDFAAAFHVGEADTHITTVDADGVALAAIQGLNEVVQARPAPPSARRMRAR